MRTTGVKEESFPDFPIIKVVHQPPQTHPISVFNLLCSFFARYLFRLSFSNYFQNRDFRKLTADKNREKLILGTKTKREKFPLFPWKQVQEPRKTNE